MNLNPNDDTLHVNFPSPSPFPQSVPASGKPSPAAGLSRPRLAKVRKHLASPPVKPAAVPDSRDPPDRAGGGGTQVLRDRLYTWNPFASEAGSQVSDNPARPNSGTFESLKSQGSDFVSSDGSVTNSNMKNIGSGEGSGIFGSAGSVFVAGSVSNSKSKDIGLANMPGTTFSFASEGSGNLDTGPFVIESGVKRSSNLSRNQAENSSGPILGNLESVKSENVDFVFGSSTLSNSSTKNVGLGSTRDSAFSCTSGANENARAKLFEGSVKNGSNMSQNSSQSYDEGPFSQLPDEMRKLKLQNTGNEDGFEKMKHVDHRSTVDEKNVFLVGGSKIAPNEGRNSDARVFGCGSSLKNSSSLRQNSSVGSDEALFSQLHDDMRKLKLQSAGNEEGYEKTKQADHRPTVDENKFIFGGSKNSPNEASGNSDAGVFVFGSGMKSSFTMSRNSSLRSDEGSLSHLPDEMRKLKLQTTNDEDSFGKIKQADHRSTVDKNKFIFEGSKNGPNEESNNSDAGVFEFGSNVKNSSSLSQNTSIGSDEDSFSQVPYKMSKLNLQAAAANEDGFRKTKQADCRSKVGKENIFIFGGGDNELNSCSSASNMLPKEMKKLNLGSEEAIQNTKGGSVDFAAGAFGFRSDLKTSSVSGRMAGKPFASMEKSTASDFPDYNAQGSWNDYNFKSTKETDCRHKVDVSAGFVFGNSNAASVSSVGAAGNTLPDDMKKLNLGSKTENSVGSTEPFFSADGLPADGPTSFKFSFEAGKRDHSTSMNAIPQPHPHEGIRPISITTTSSHPSSPRTCFESVGTGITFTSMQEGLQTPRMEFRKQKQDTSCYSKENLFTSPYPNMTFSTKKEEVKGTRTRKRRGISRQSAPVAKQFISTEKSSHENLEPESPSGYSPMDFSPYQENLVAGQCSREDSVTSDESIHLVSPGASTDSHISVFVDGREEELVSATQDLNINDDDLEHRELDEDGSKVYAERNFSAESSSVDVQTSGLGNGSLKSKDEITGFDSDSRTAAAEAETAKLRSNIEREASEGGTLFTSASSLEDQFESNFTFAASPFVQRPVSASKRYYRRKSRMKTGQDLCDCLPDAKVPYTSPSSKSLPVASTYVPDPSQSLNGTASVPQTENDNRAEKIEKPEASQESISTAASIAALEACEKWRLRGNQAYANGHLSKAEDYYTRGVNSVSKNETLRSCILALMLCYSNRAATRMSLGRMREAISDCNMAIAIDPNFLRAQVRAANCHLALGEIEDALKHFKKCLQSENNVNSDQKILIEASEGLRKAQRVSDCMDQYAELLLKRTMSDATKALQIISEALSISPHSDSLMEMKAEALLMLRSYEEVIQLCEQTLDSAEKNSIRTGSDGQSKDIDSSPERLWRWHLISKSYFYLGKLDEALELLQKHEKVKPTADTFQNRSRESLISITGIIRQLLCLKAAGNDAFQAGRHLEAVEHYTAALTCNTESRPFAAICFCNRAAAYQALGQITDAIADCTLAVALDASYPKAISRRATLHEMIRDYGQAANDLNRLISLLEKKSKDKNVSGTLVRSTSNCCDLNQARLRLSTMEEEARKGTPLDMYMILGIEPSSSAADVKKAYRRAALRHHPDKAGHFLARNENVDELWRQVADEVHMDAERLFKMIGEAYTVLSDPAKRLQYDEEEEMRTTTKKGYNGSSKPKASDDNYSSSQSVKRRQWRAYRSSHQHSSEY